MFGKGGPTLFELIHQALCSTERGYDLLAPKFDATPFRTPDAILGPAAEAIGPVDSALDLCCGTGAAMRVLKPRCRARLVGVDFSQGMLEQARASLHSVPGDVEPEFIRADIFACAFDREFDVVTCFGALGHVPQTQQTEFLRMVYSALKPGGRFVFVTGRRPPLLSVAGLAFRTFNAVMRARNALLKPEFIMYYLTFLLPDAERSLSDAGFTVEIREHPFGPELKQYSLVIATRAA